MTFRELCIELELRGLIEIHSAYRTDNEVVARLQACDAAITVFEALNWCTRWIAEIEEIEESVREITGFRDLQDIEFSKLSSVLIEPPQEYP